MPHLEEIAKTGVSGPLRSTLPPQSLPAWPSFATGMNPGKHGVYSFFTIEPSTHVARPFSSEDIRGLTIWDYLSSKGSQCILVNMPLTYPPYPISGIMVSGFPAPPGPIKSAEITCFPESLGDELKSVAPGYKIEPPITRDYQTVIGDESTILKMIYDTMKERTRLALYLIKEKPWDVFCVIFTCSDRVEHIFWRHFEPKHPASTAKGLHEYSSVIPEFFHALDDALGLIRAKIDNSTTTIVVSDHGHSAQVAQVGVNQLLADVGMLKYHGAYRVGLTRDRLTRLAASLGLSVFLVKRLVPKRFLDKISSGVEYSQSTAYCYRFGAINLNIKGRDGDGVVEKEKFDLMRDKIAALLLGYTDSQTGERIVEKVLKPEEIYWGERLSAAPDLLAIFRDGYGPESWNPNGKTIQRIDSSEFDVTKPIIECGGHHWLSTMNGILFACGPSISRGEPVNGAEIIDIAPTIIHLLSLPIPKNIDGKVLPIFRHDSEAALRPIQYASDLQIHSQPASTWTEQEEAEVTKRLADLGYLG